MTYLAERRLAWSCGAAALLAAAPAGVSSRTDAPAPIRRDQLCVTEGRVTEGAGGALSVSDAKMRAIVPSATRPSIEARFTYLGPTAQTSALGSGEVRRQFGLKLRAQDPCNLVYAMWRFEPTPEVVVQIKSNPGEHESSVCHNDGYRTIRPSRIWPVAAPAAGSSHRLSARMQGSAVEVQVDGDPAWQGDLGPDALADNGPVGMRSDNARLSLSLYAAAGSGAAPTCPSGGSD